MVEVEPVRKEALPVGVEPGCRPLDLIQAQGPTVDREGATQVGGVRAQNHAELLRQDRTGTGAVAGLGVEGVEHRGGGIRQGHALFEKLLERRGRCAPRAPR